jgi:hypothetical protein
MVSMTEDELNYRKSLPIDAMTEGETKPSESEIDMSAFNRGAAEAAKMFRPPTDLEMHIEHMPTTHRELFIAGARWATARSAEQIKTLSEALNAIANSYDMVTKVACELDENHNGPVHGAMRAFNLCIAPKARDALKACGLGGENEVG